MPGRKQGFGDSLELGKVVAGIDGSCLSLNGELATESAIHVLNAMLQNVKHLQREARPVSRKVPPACVAGFTHAIGLPEGCSRHGWRAYWQRGRRQIRKQILRLEDCRQIELILQKAGMPTLRKLNDCGVWKKACQSLRFALRRQESIRF